MIKFPILMYDLRNFSNLEIEKLLNTSLSAITKENIKDIPYQYSLIITKKQEELFKDINAHLIIDTLDPKILESLLLDFTKVYQGEIIFDDFVGHEIYFMVNKENYKNLRRFINNDMINFIKNSENFNLIIDFGNEIDYKDLNNKNSTDFINLIQDLQKINLNFLRSNIKIIFKLPENEELNLNQISMITELSNISGVLIVENLNK